MYYFLTLICRLIVDKKVIIDFFYLQFGRKRGRYKLREKNKFESIYSLNIT